MIVKIFVTVLILFTHTLGQGMIKKSNTLYLELGGNCILYSINYENEIFENFSPRLGVSYFSLNKVSNSGPNSGGRFTASFMINYLVNLYKNNKIEIGVGYTSILGYESRSAIAFGYRYSPDDGGVVFKFTFTPIINSNYFDDKIWFGLGVGIKF